MRAIAIGPRQRATRGLAAVVSVALVASIVALGGAGAGRALAVNPVDVEFSTQPLGANIGGGVATGEPDVPWPVQPVVSLTGDWDPTFAYTVTLQIDPSSPDSGGPGWLTCTGGTTRDMSNGSAQFSGCQIDTVGDAYRLLATVTGTTALGEPLPPMEVTSLAFSIKGGGSPIAAGIAFTTQPLGADAVGPRRTAQAGRAWAVQPVVSVLDKEGDVVTTDNRTVVQLRISDGAPLTGGPGNLSCTSGTSIAVRNGVARFSGCAIDAPGTFYELTASTYSSGSTRVLSDESFAFDITGGSIGARAKFTTEPLGAVLGSPAPSAPSGTPWGIQPVVSIVDAAGRLVRTDFATIVTLSIDGQSPRGGTLDCAGGVTQQVAGGVAPFYGCQITGPGAGYVLRATAQSPGGSLIYDLSLPFTITSVASALDLYPSAFTVRPNELLTLTATLTGQGAGGQSIVFQRQQPGDAGWVNLGTSQTGASGVATYTFDPLYTADYRAVFNGSGGLSAALSAADTVAVQAAVTLAPTTPTSVKKGTVVRYTARVTPTGVPSASVRFLFYRYADGGWVFFTSRTVRLSSSGVATLSWTWGTPGKWYVIANAPTTPYYSQGSSKTIRVTVK